MKLRQDRHLVDPEGLHLAFITNPPSLQESCRADGSERQAPHMYKGNAACRRLGDQGQQDARVPGPPTERTTTRFGLAGCQNRMLIIGGT